MNEFGSLENILKIIKKLRQNKRRETIENNLENILILKISRTLKSDMKIDIIVLEKISDTDFNFNTFSKFFEKYGFNNLQSKNN